MFLYLTTDGLVISKEWGRFLVRNPLSQEDNEQQIPISLVEGMVIFGRIQLTTDVIRACLKGNIPVFFLSKTGTFFGKLDSLEAKNVDLLYSHIQASLNPEIALRYAKSIISAKLHNSKVMLQRWARFYPKPSRDLTKYQQSLDALQTSLQDSVTLEAVRWLEGLWARVYFEAFGKCIPAPFSFTGRNRRPPKDPVDSLLSLGYTLLAQTIEMILNVQGIEISLKTWNFFLSWI